MEFKSNFRINPAERHILITGVGFKAISGIDGKFDVFESQAVKPNIGAAVALRAAQAGYSITIVARSPEKLEQIRDSITNRTGVNVEIHTVDILDRESVQGLTNHMSTKKEIDFVQCAGLTAGSYQLKDDNPYLPVEEIPEELPTLEFDTVVRGLLNVVQVFLPRWRGQRQTRLAVVSSMSGIRSYPLGFAHCSAKAGLHAAVECLTIELAPDRIFVSEVKPGIVDTGLYDSEAVKQAVVRVGRYFGYDYTNGFPQMSPFTVADSVLFALTTEIPCLSINMVAEGQFPHENVEERFR